MGVARSGRLPVPALLIILVYGAILLGVALSVPFPSLIDELPHLSVIRSQYVHPTLFPDWNQYLILRADDLSRWSDTGNYINHPALYYLLFAPLMALTSDPLAFRLGNVLLSTGALLLAVIAVHRRFAPETVSPTLFAILAAAFPKAAMVGGMINNDNLAAVAAAAVFAGLTGLSGAPWWILAGLAIAGWTKLTAFIGLGAVVGAWLGLRLIRGEGRSSLRLLLFAALGLSIGAVPYIATLIRTGHVLWVNETVWRVPLERRLSLDLAAYGRLFLRNLVMKWPAAEGVYAPPLALAGLLAPFLLALAGIRNRAVRSLGIAYGIGLIFLLLVHFAFGWRSFQQMGDLTIMQTRYYNVLWPGIALAATVGLGRLGRRWRWAGWIGLLLCLSPTMIGAMLYAWL